MNTTTASTEPASNGCPDWCESAAHHAWDKDGESSWTRCHQRQLFEGVWLSYAENATPTPAGGLETSVTEPVVELTDTPDYIHDGETLRTMARALLEAAAVLSPRRPPVLALAGDDQDLVETLTPEELAKVTLHTEGYFKGYADALRAHRRPAPLAS